MTDDTGVRLGVLVGRTGRQWRRALDLRLQPFDLSEAMWLPLLHLSRAEGPMRQKDVAAALSLDKSSVVRVLRNLEEANLIACDEATDDHRIKSVRITPRGRKLAEKVEVVSRDLERELLAEAPAGDVAKAREVLERVLGLLERMSGAKP